MSGYSQIQTDPAYREKRFNDLKRDLLYFSDALNKIYTVMPTGGIKFYPSSGEIEHIIPTEWQTIIDKILLMKDEFIKNNYPEFYN